MTVGFRWGNHDLLR